MRFGAFFKTARLAFFAAALFISAGVTALADSYTIVPVGSARNFVSPRGLNNSGQIAGLFLSPDDPPDEESTLRAFIFSRGMFREIEVPTSVSRLATGINNSGLVVGRYDDQSRSRSIPFLSSNGNPARVLDSFVNTNIVTGSINDAGQFTGFINGDFQGSRAFIIQEDELQLLPTLGGTRARGVDINNFGEVVGQSTVGTEENPDDAAHAFLYDRNGTLHDLGSLGGGRTGVGAINDAGQIVGSSYIAEELDTFHAFLYQDGVMTDLSRTVGGLSSGAIDINNLGQIVGGREISDGVFSPYLYSNGNVQDLNDLLAPNSGWVLSSVFYINDRGQIVGNGFFNGESRPFLMSPSDLGTEPVPEPATMILLGTGLAGIGGAVRRKRKTKS